MGRNVGRWGRFGGAGLILVCCGLLVGCTRSSPPAAQNGAKGTGALDVPNGPLAGEQWPSPSDEECQAFAQSMAQAIQEGNIVSINELIDWDTVLLRCVREDGPLGESAKGFVQGTKASVSSPTGIAGQLAKCSADGATYHLLRSRTRDGRKTVLFRMVHPSAGVNYHEYLLANKPDGQTRAIDLYVFLSAENISTTLRRWYLPVAAHQNRGFLERLTGQENGLVKYAGQVETLVSRLQARQFQDVLNIYRSLPESVQQEKSLLLLRLQAAMQVSEDEYRRAIDTFLRQYPDDPCTDMLSIDHYVMKKQFDKAVSCINRVDQAVEGDPYLISLRGRFYIAAGNKSKARESFDAAINAEPTLTDPYEGMAQLCAEEGDFAGVVHWLDELEQKFQFQVSFPDLESAAEYAEFVKSAEYKAWKAERTK